MIEEKIKPEYDKVLQGIWELLKEDINKELSNNKKYLKKTS